MKKWAYYNEFDPKAAAWIRELIKQRLITDGEVDERSISEVKPDDVSGYMRVHWFAGIAGWDLALKLAGWPEDRPVWTGSCPCQPFSCAGNQQGVEDPRHLWPYFFRLIRECRPVTVFGEQVEGAIGHGWLDGVCGDLEAEGYACGAHVLGAHSVGAPHIRQRLYWVANATDSERRRGISGTQAGVGTDSERRRGSPSSSNDGWLADAKHNGWRADEPGRGSEGRATDGRDSEAVRVGDTNHAGPQGRNGEELRERSEQFPAREGSSQGFWHDTIWHACRDRKARRISPEPGVFPLAHGIPGRVGLLRGYGNAIVPQVAAEFIQAYCEAIEEI